MHGIHHRTKGAQIRRRTLRPPGKPDPARGESDESDSAWERRLNTAVLDTADVLIVILKPDGRIVRFNRACERATGYTAAEVVGRPFLNLLVPPEDRDGVREVFSALATGKFPNSHENDWVAKDGSRRRLRWSNTVLLNGSSKVEYVVSTSLDITYQRGVEAKVADAGQEWALTFDAIPDLVMIVGPDFRVVRANRALAGRLGCRPEDLAGRPCHSVMQCGNPVPERCPHHRLLLDNQPHSYEVNDPGLGGDFQISVAPLLDRSGGLIGSVHVAREITELKRVQNDLRDARDRLESRVRERTAELAATVERLHAEVEERTRVEALLRDAELRYRTVADFTHDWEYWEGPDGAMRYVSPACTAVTGYGPEAFMADPQLLHRIVIGEDIPVWLGHRKDAFAFKGAPVQFRICRADGAIRWLEHACQPVVDGNGAFLGFRGSNRDVTDRKRDEALLAQQRDELARVGRVNAMGELAASLAHELNQPLTASLADTETARLLLSKPKPNLKSIRAILRDIAASQRRAGEIVQRVRAQVSPGLLRMRTLDLTVLAPESIKLVQNRAALAGIDIEPRLQPGLPPIRGNRVHLVQVLTNLMLNAVEAMEDLPAERCRLSVMSGVRDDGLLAVEVADTGPGIAPERLTAIFEPFHTTKSKGLGMGLAIARSIATAHGGRLEARNNPAGGATFTLVLPAHHPPEGA